ncbi:hypothetical protein [Methylocystis sp. JR02]|uniref:hypothetical protein n=1 Tax=Methylocystis sp. JR02 TaxID=3046284 RepID=UPI0024BBC23D|nr:hypothetical protein [Methylocystis sp. JR02]MDJ0450626.1 hypothetical protein [Methylocystis sp. JR02]
MIQFVAFRQESNAREQQFRARVAADLNIMACAEQFDRVIRGERAAPRRQFEAGRDSKRQEECDEQRRTLLAPKNESSFTQAVDHGTPLGDAS